MVAIATTFITSLGILGLVSSLQLSCLQDGSEPMPTRLLYKVVHAIWNSLLAEAFLYFSNFDIWF
jgi:hypothetical protein